MQQGRARRTDHGAVGVGDLAAGADDVGATDLSQTGNGQGRGQHVAGNDIIGTTSEITDGDGALVCSTSATLVHRGADA